MQDDAVPMLAAMLAAYDDYRAGAAGNGGRK
jgi:hypothetical protein